MAFSPDGSLLTTLSEKIARLWEVSNSFVPPIVLLNSHQEEVVALAFNLDGTRLATASKDKTARIWDIDHIFSQEFAEQPQLKGLTVEGLIDLAKTKKPTLIDVRNNVGSYNFTEKPIEKLRSEE